MTKKNNTTTSKKKSGRRLTVKQRLFVQEYLVDLNALQAALRAGYSKAKAKNASEFLKDPRIKKAVNTSLATRSKRIEITQDKVLQAIANIAFSNYRNVAEWTNEKLTLKPSDTLTDEQAALISKISSTVTETSSKTEIKLHDTMKALELLARHLGMFDDKVSLDIRGNIGVSQCTEKSLEAMNALKRIREQREQANNEIGL